MRARRGYIRKKTLKGCEISSFILAATHLIPYEGLDSSDSKYDIGYHKELGVLHLIRAGNSAEEGFWESDRVDIYPPTSMYSVAPPMGGGTLTWSILTPHLYF